MKTLIVSALLFNIIFVAKFSDLSVGIARLARYGFFTKTSSTLYTKEKKNVVCFSNGFNRLKKRRGFSYYQTVERIKTYSDIYGVDYKTVVAMARTESYFYVNSVYPISRSGAMGLLQIMPKTRKRLFKDLGLHHNDWSLDSHIHAAVYYISQIDESIDDNYRTPYFTNRDVKIAAYNYGVRGILRRLNNKKKKVLRRHRYVWKVNLYKELLKPDQKIFHN